MSFGGATFLLHAESRTHFFATTTADQVLDLGKGAAVVEVDKPPGRPRKRKAVGDQGE